MDHVIIAGDTTGGRVWEDLDLYLQRRWTHPSGASLGVLCAMIDHGFRSKEVTAYVLPRQGQRIYACKGIGTMGAPAIRRPKTATKKDLYLITVGTYTLKNTLFARLRQQDAGPGYIHFEESLPPEYFKQLTAEIHRVKYSKGHEVRFYEKKKHIRNETLDCAVYAHAALLTLQSMGLNLHAAVDALASGSYSQPAPVSRGFTVKSKGVS